MKQQSRQQPNQQSGNMQGTVPVSRAVNLFLMSALGLFGICVCIVVTVIGTREFEQIQQTEQQERVDSLGDSVETYVDNRLNILHGQAKFSSIKQAVMQPKDHKADITDFMSTLSILGTKPQMVLLDFEGTRIHKTQENPDVDFTGYPWVSRIIDGTQSQYAGILQLPGGPHWCIAVPVLYRGQPEGILTVVIPLQNMIKSSHLSGITSGEEMKILQKGTVLARFGADNPAGSTQKTVLDRFKLTLEYTEQETRISPARNRLLITIIGILLLMSLPIALTTVALARKWFVKPLQQLRDATSSISNKTGTAFFSGQGSRIQEIALLSDDLKVMAKQVDDRESKLEELVEERTGELKKSEERLELAMDAGKHGMWDLNIGTGETYFDKRYYTMAGYENNEFPQNFDAWADRVHPEDLPGAKAAIKAYLSGESDHYDAELRWKQRDGSWMWIQAKGKIVERDASGAPVRAIGTHTDITKQKQAEQELKEQTVLQEILCKISNDFINLPWEESDAPIQNALATLGQFAGLDRTYIFSYDFEKQTTSNTYEWCNDGISPKIEELQDVPLEAVPDWVEHHKKGESMLIPDVSELSHQSGLREILAPQEIKSLLAIPMMNGDQCLGFAGFDAVRNIHEFTEKEQKLLQVFSLMLVNLYNRSKAEKELARLSSAVKQSPSVVAITDSDGKLEYVNPKFIEITGYSLEEVIGQNTRILKSGQHPAAMYKELWETISSGKTWRGEMHNKKKNGELFWEMASISPLFDAKGNIINYLKVAENITELKETNKSLEEETAKAKDLAEQAQSANRAKTEFLANMSHEIRTPMNAVLGFAQVLERDSSLTPKQSEHVSTISRSGNHLLGLINNILDISKIEAGKIELTLSVFSLQDLLDDLEMMFRSRAEARHLQLTVDRDEGLPSHVRTDEDKVRKVLVNLLGNAVKFTEQGGITLRVRSEPVRGRTQGEDKSLRLVFEVEDSGPGISQSELDRIFDTFSQGEAGARAGGTGLGLALSRQLAEMMGGEITCESEPGKGSCFCFDLLCEPAQADQKKPRESRRVAGLATGTDPGRILVVDDNAANRDLLHVLLLPLGFEIRDAENGREAVEIFDKWSPHAVLMDMRMPVMDGYEATRRIKATRAGRATPIIALTAQAFKEQEEEILATGASAYISKPFQDEAFYEVLGKYLGLTFVYEEKSAGAQKHPGAFDLTPEDLAALPRDLVQAMLEALAEGDITQLLELIRQVEPLDRDAAWGLKALADRYDYSMLEKLLCNGGNDNE